MLQTGSGVQMTSTVIGGAVYSLSSMEPMVYNNYNVWSNVENGASEDYNRMSAKSSLTQAEGNQGWGLGTLYDATHGTTTICGPSGSATARPQCDAQARSCARECMRTRMRMRACVRSCVWRW